MPLSTAPWTHAPFTRLFIPFAGGILLADLYPPVGSVVFAIAIPAIFLLIVTGMLSVQLAYRMRMIQGTCLLTLIICVGICLHIMHDPRWRADWYGHRISATMFQVLIDQPPEQKANSYKAIVQVEAVFEQHVWHAAGGRMLVYLARDGLQENYEPGQRLLISGKLKAITNPGNPGEFDYRRYAARHGLYHTVYVPADQAMVTGREAISFPGRFIAHLRYRTLSILRKYAGGDEQVTGLAEALLIGYTADLDDELSADYSRAGVIHVIAISGLHLGLIYAMLAWICARIPVIKKRVWVSVLVTLFCLWIFALLTGASASVLRSAVMFTVLGAGRMIGRKASLYNSLAASAMLLCVYDSNYLWDMGFQLSYLALIGIAWLQKPVYRLLFIRQKMGRYVWEMASVTLSAQVFTTPLCLYYFHQFPVYFLFTNLLVVPISTVILCTELFLLLISWWTPAALLTGKLIGWQILLMNALVDRSNQLPGALIENIPMRLAQEWALYLIIWAAACWWIGRSTLWKNIACMAVMIYLILCIGYRLQTRGQQKLVVYNLRGSSVIEWIHGREGYTLFRKIRGPDSTRIKMLLQQSHLALGIPPVLKNLPGQSFVIGHKKLLIVTSPIRCDQPEKVDILVIAGDPMMDMQKLLECVQPGEILFDAANTLWKIVKWKKDCEELLLQCYSIPESGAYISDLH